MKHTCIWSYSSCYVTILLLLFPQPNAAKNLTSTHSKPIAQSTNYLQILSNDLIIRFRLWNSIEKKNKNSRTHNQWSNKRKTKRMKQQLSRCGLFDHNSIFKENEGCKWRQHQFHFKLPENLHHLFSMYTFHKTM